MSNRIAVFDDGVIQQLDAPVALYESRRFLRRAVHRREQHAGRHGGFAVERGAAITLDSGDKVKALAVNTDGKGSRTSLSIRPERCIVSKKKTAVSVR